MKKTSLFILLAAFCLTTIQAAVTLQSPNKKISVEINTKGKLTYTVLLNGQPVMGNNEVTLTEASGKVYGENPKLKSKKYSTINETVKPFFPLKKATIENKCNVLTLTLDGYSIQFRAYNDGVAYRFITSLKDDLIVTDECLKIGLQSDDVAHMQLNPGFGTSNEQPYQHKKISEYQEKDGVANLPVLFQTTKGVKIFFSEAAQWDYPGMFLKGTGTSVLQTTTPTDPRSNKAAQKYIAKTNGNRALPWRYFFITENDGDLLECTMNARLADKCKIDDVSWIKPGQVSWDWWNGWNVYGPDVNFKCGINTETYKYFIDFASKYKIPYIIMDDGWAKNNENPLVARDGLDLKELIRYGKEKNVGIMLWMPWNAAVKYPQFFALYEELGIKGMKIDFMDRTDQEIVNFYENTAAEAAKHHLLLDFHGAYRPAGLEFVYPNILSHEGVLGMEQESRCTPDNTLYEMFIRNVAGPMDYTPGAMISMQPECFRECRPNNASIGTRAYQMALYIVMESNIQMLSDSPSNYYRNPDCTEFITSIPVNWDDTRALSAVIGQYEIIAKRRGAKWFIGGVTNNNERRQEITLDFLEDGKTYTMTSFEDGASASYQALHYVKNSRQVKKGDKIQIKMTRNGGFAAVIE